MPLHRPRRPDPNTLQYLQQLPTDSVDAAVAALQEISQQELASLAGTEVGAAAIERLLTTAPPHHALTALDACRTYGMHLATHRYGSHVVQTILQRVTLAMTTTTTTTTVHDNNDDDNKDTTTTTTAPVSPPPTKVQLHEQLTPLLTDLVLTELDLIDLVYHMCGSHVVRSLVACCGGVLEVHAAPALQRGKVKKKKNKKKKKQVDATTTEQRRLNTITLTKPAPDNSNNNKYHYPTKELLHLLHTLSDTLLQAFDPTDWPYHASSSALVGVVLQVLSMQQPEEAQASTTSTSTTTTTTTTQWIQALDLPTHWNDYVNDTSASRLVEAAAKSCRDDELFERLFLTPVLDHMTRLLANDNAAHVVQTVVENLRTAEQLDQIMANIDMAVVLQHRRHVLLAMVRAAQTETQQQSLVQQIARPHVLATTLLKCHQSLYLVDATGAQVLHHIITTFPSTIVQQPLLLDHILPELLTDTTEYWCDSVASRWIVEPICDNYAPLVERPCRRLLPTVAQHRVGRHVVTALNAHLPPQRQYAVAEVQKKVRRKGGHDHHPPDNKNNNNKRTWEETTTTTTTD